MRALVNAFDYLVEQEEQGLQQVEAVAQPQLV
jgi:hypothetical protein